MTSPAMAPPPARPPWLTPQNVIIAAVALVALVGILAVIVFTGASSPPGPNVVDAGPTSTISAEAALQTVVNDLSHYVEAARGLKFLHPVKAVLANDKDFAARFQALGANRPDANQLAGNIATLKALGILPADFTPPAGNDATGVLGYYDPTSKEIVVRGDYASVYVRKTIVHELTHALQDQHFDLSHLLAAGFDDRSIAARSLVEGDARRVEQNWVSTLSLAEQGLLERQAQAHGDEEYPTGFSVGLGQFPYTLGSKFVNKLLTDRGQAALDAAFATSPPTSTKQIIVPAAFEQGDIPVIVDPPSAGGPMVDHGTIGTLELVYMFSDAVPAGVAVRAALEWTGSSYVTWLGPTGPCARLAVDAAPTGSLHTAFADWAARGLNRSVSGSNPIIVTGCV